MTTTTTMTRTAARVAGRSAIVGTWRFRSLYVMGVLVSLGYYWPAFWGGAHAGGEYAGHEEGTRRLIQTGGFTH